MWSDFALLALAAAAALASRSCDAKTIRIVIPDEGVSATRGSFSSTSQFDSERFRSLDYYHYLRHPMSCLGTASFNSLMELQAEPRSIATLDDVRTATASYVSVLRYRRCTASANGAVREAANYLKQHWAASAVAVTELVADIDTLSALIFNSMQLRTLIETYPTYDDLFLGPNAIVPHYSSVFRANVMHLSLRTEEKLFANYLTQIPTSIFGENGSEFRFEAVALLGDVIDFFTVRELAEIALQMTDIMHVLWDHSLYVDTTLFKSNVKRCFVVIMYDPTLDFDSYYPRRFKVKSLLTDRCVKRFRDETERLSFDYTKLVSVLLENTDVGGVYSIDNDVTVDLTYPNDLHKPYYALAVNTVLNPATTWHGMPIDITYSSAQAILSYYNPRIQYLAGGHASFEWYCNLNYVLSPPQFRPPPRHIKSILKKYANNIIEVNDVITMDMAFVIEHNYRTGIHVDEMSQSTFSFTEAVKSSFTKDLASGLPVFYTYVNISEFATEDSYNRYIDHAILLNDLAVDMNNVALPLFVTPSLSTPKNAIIGYLIPGTVTALEEDLILRPCMISVGSRDAPFMSRLFTQAIDTILKMAEKGVNYVPPVGYLSETGDCMFPHTKTFDTLVIPDPLYVSPKTINFGLNTPQIPVGICQNEYMRANGLIAAITFLRYHMDPSEYSKMISLLTRDLAEVGNDLNAFTRESSLSWKYASTQVVYRRLRPANQKIAAAFMDVRNIDQLKDANTLMQSIYQS